MLMVRVWLCLGLSCELCCVVGFGAELQHGSLDYGALGNIIYVPVLPCWRAQPEDLGTGNNSVIEAYKSRPDMTDRGSWIATLQDFSSFFGECLASFVATAPVSACHSRRQCAGKTCHLILLIDCFHPIRTTEFGYSF